MCTSLTSNGCGPGRASRCAPTSMRSPRPWPTVCAEVGQSPGDHPQAGDGGRSSEFPVHLRPRLPAASHPPRSPHEDKHQKGVDRARRVGIAGGGVFQLEQEDRIGRVRRQDFDHERGQRERPRPQRLGDPVHGRQGPEGDRRATQDRLRQPGRVLPRGDDRRQRGRCVRERRAERRRRPCDPDRQLPGHHGRGRRQVRRADGERQQHLVGADRNPAQRQHRVVQRLERQEGRDRRQRRHARRLRHPRG